MNDPKPHSKLHKLLQHGLTVDDIEGELELIEAKRVEIISYEV